MTGLRELPSERVREPGQPHMHHLRSRQGWQWPRRRPGPAQPSAPAARADRRHAVTPVTAVIIAATLLALALRLYQLSRPGLLLGVTEYDDGPYFGSAVRLLNGAIPYRDFAIAQPPGITLLMLPAALLSKLTGTAWALAVGRILTTLAGSCSVPLAGRLVRRRGLVATVLACGVTAVFPDAIAAAHTVMVEPWLVLFCLLGTAAAFDGDRLAASPRRLAWAGAAFGFAGAIEAWAIFPVIGLLILLLRKPKNAAIFVTTMTAGFGVPVLPFVILAPGRLYADIVQAQRRAEPIRVPIAAAHGLSRLREMTGLTSLDPPSSVQILAAILILAIIFGALVAAHLISNAEPAELDWFAVAAFAIISAAFLLPPQFYYHFPAFLAPFLAMATALTVARLIDVTWPAASRRSWRRRLAAGLAGALIVTMAVIQVAREARTGTDLTGPTLTAVRHLIPPGACLITDQVSFSIAFNRFTSTQPGCPLLISSVATNYAMTDGHDPQTGAGKYPELVAIWHNAFSHAQYVWLSRQAGSRIPWTPALANYFRDRFAPILINPAGALYQRATSAWPVRRVPPQSRRARPRSRPWRTR